MSTTNTKGKTTQATISTGTKRAILIALFFTALLASIGLPQSSIAQTAATTSITNTNQTSAAKTTEAPQSPQVKGVITPCLATESTSQGPEYKAGPPVRQGQDFAKGIPGQRLIVTGKVVNMYTCKPVRGAVIDLWQSNSTGDYDYKGYNLRGKIITDKDGNYVLYTIYPARLKTNDPNLTRPSHIHVIVGVPGQPQITTQIFLEDQPKDSALKPSLIAIPATASNGTKIAHFNFAIEDFRGFDISEGLRGNPTIGALRGEEPN